MTDVFKPSSPATADQEGQVSDQLLGLALLAGAAIAYLAPRFQSACQEAERKFDRAELLAAYRRRKNWKRSDINNLKTLNLNGVAQRRLEKLEGLGRPVVKRRVGLANHVAKNLNTFAYAFGEAAPQPLREKAIKNLPWWDHLVEAIYRGEYERALEMKVKSPSEHAEVTIGKRLGLSQSKVRQVCGRIRSIRRKDPEGADFPPTTLSAFQAWIETGSHDRLWSDPVQ